MANKIEGLKIALGADTIEVTTALSGINKTSKDLQSELKEVERLLKLDPKNVELAAQKQEILAKSVQAAKEKLDTLKIAATQAAEKLANGEIGEDQYRALQREVIAAEQKLRNLEKQARGTGSELEDVGKDAKAAGDNAEKSKSGWEKLGEKIKGVGVAGIASIAAIGATVINTLKSLASAAFDTADNLMRMADVTGRSVEELQRLQYIGDDVGVSLDTISSAQKKLVNAMDEARNGATKYVDAFDKIGVSVTNSDGSLRNATEVMYDVFDALALIGNETERDAAALDIFGRSATELNPLILAGGDAMRELADQADKTGAVMSEKAVAALDSVGDAIDHVKQSAKALVGEGLAKIIDVFDGNEASQYADKIREMSEEAERNKAAHADTAQAIEIQSLQTSIMIGHLKALSENTSRTASETEIMLGLIDELNKSVPGLNLAYSELNGTLSLTSDELISIALAEEKRASLANDTARMIELAKEIIPIEEAYKDARKKTTEAENAYNHAIKEGVALSGSAYTEQMKLYSTWLTYKNAADDIATTYSDMYNELDGLKKQYDGQIPSVEKATTTTEMLTAATERLSKILSESSDKLADTTRAASVLEGANKRLTDAMDEQRQSGSLSISTTNSLIDSGYALALQIDEETGAVTINKEAYIALANAKIEEQIVALQTDRNAIAEALKTERQAILDVATSYYDAAIAVSEFNKSDAAKNSTAAIAGFDAQIAALERLKTGLGKTAVATTSYSKAVKESKTEAELAAEAITKAAKDSLTAFQTQKKELDHLKALDLVNEGDYYKQLVKLRDDYLTDDGNVDEYRKTTEQIHTYEKAMLDNTLQAYESQLDNIGDVFKSSLSEIETQIKNVERQQESFAGKISDYGNLFTKEKQDDKSETLAVNDIQEQINVLDKYADTLQKLKASGVSSDLMAEISAMSIDDTIAYGAELLSMGEDDLNNYVTLWEEKQAKAKEIAEEYYKDQINALKTDYSTQLETALETIQDTAYTSGEDTAQNLIDGALSLSGDLTESYKQMAIDAVAAYEKSFKDASSKLNLSFSNIDTPQTNANVSAQHSGAGGSVDNAQITDLINAINKLAEPSPSNTGSDASGGNSVVYLDSMAVGRAILPVLRDLDSASPQIRNDF